MKRNLAIVLFSLALPSTLAGQQPPTFRSGVDLVTLDIRVVDARGQFVDDVSPGDLKIFEDGREQTLSTFERVRIPMPPADTREAPPAGDTSPEPALAPPPRPDVAANDGPAPALAEGRLYVLLMDDLRTSPSYAADVRAQAREFVERHVTSSDRAVVLTTSGRQRSAPEFTSDRRRLLESIAQFAGDAGFVASAMCEAGGANAGQCAVGNDLGALRSLTAVSTWLAPLAGQRKTLLLFSEGLSIDQAEYVFGPDPTVIDPAAPPGSVDSGDPTASAGGVRLSQKVGAAAAAFSVVVPALQAAEGAAARANVVIYPLDPRRRPEASFDRIVSDASSYYLLGYTPTNGKHDGTFRKLEVRALRPGLRVEARRGYTASNDTPSSGANTEAADTASTLRAMMATPIQLAGLPMRVTAPAFAGGGPKASVEVIVDIAGRDLMAASAASGGKGSIALLMTIAGADGRVEASERGSLDMNLSASTRDRVAANGVRVMSRMDVAPGQYLLRVAAVDEGGSSRGSVQYGLDVPDFSKGPVAMSSLALALASAGDPPTTGSDKTWSARFGRAPTTMRTFTDSDELVVSGEIYGNDLRLDDLEATTTVRNASGDVVFDHRAVIEQAAGAARTFRHSTMVSLRDLDPGDYLLSVETTAPDASAALSQEIPFTVR